MIEFDVYDITTTEGLAEAAMCEVMGYGEVPLVVDEDDNVYRMEDIHLIVKGFKNEI